MTKDGGSRFAVVTIAASAAIAIGLAVYSEHLPNTSRVGVSPARQGAGQMPLNENFLKGGSLQRGLTGDEKPQEYIVVETGTEAPRYVTREFTVHTGNVVSVTLQNNSKVGHSDNWVLVKPGTRKQVEEAAQETPPEWNWIPETSNILAFVPLTPPGYSIIRLFQAPNEPGDYPFLCTYADRGMAMNGVLHVRD